MILAKKPPMGWNSWNTFRGRISEELVMQTADAMADSGLAAAGYEYLVLDDFWMAPERDENDRLTPDPEKFPHGIKPVIDYVHSKGLKFGLYSCCGMLTCGSMPGSFQHEFVDAATFAEWGVDFLKYDNCQKPEGLDDHLLYRRMAMALRSCGRDILFSACSWGEYDTLKWARTAGTQMWRSTCDIADNWVSMRDIAMSQFENAPYNGPCSYNDMDMLIVGMHSRLGGCTDEEYQTHFALWALMASPLMIGCDVRSMSEATKKILMNRELIAINQDEEGRPPYIWKINKDADYWGMVKVLSNGDYAFGLFNFSDRDCTIANNLNIKFWDIGLPLGTGYGFELRDVLNGRDIGVRREFVTARLKAHGCAVFRGRLVRL